MARSKQVINQFSFVKGLVTDANPLTFPENTTKDEQNWVLGIDGSRTVRKGLELESGADDLVTVPAFEDASFPIDTVKWRNAYPSTDVVVVKYKDTLYFFKDTEEGIMLTANNLGTVDLTPYVVAGAPTGAVVNYAVAMAPSSGTLYVVGRYLEPLYITIEDWDTTPVLTVTTYDVMERDFVGFDDSLGTSERPATLSEEHYYNLVNRGWTLNRINSFYNTYAKYPSNADLYIFGYYTKLDTGLESWSPSNVSQNSTGNSDAPTGHILFNVFDTTVDSEDFEGATGTSIDEAVLDVGSGEWELTTVLSVGIAIGQSFTITGNLYRYKKTTDVGSSPSSWTGVGTLDGTQTNIGPSNGTTLFTISDPITDPDWDGTNYAVVTPGIINQATSSVDFPAGTIEATRFETCAFFTGRVWYGGCDSPRIGSKIYFSQVLESPSLAGKCYQQADPTARNINELIDTDGGTIVINDMGRCLALVPMNNYLIVFASNGVWSIFGANGVFSATSYATRKISEAIILNPSAAIDMGSSLVFWSRTGIFVVREDGVTGNVVCSSVTDGVIQNYLADVPTTVWPYIRGGYDNNNKTAYFTLNHNTDNYFAAHDEMLIMDTRLGAFYVFKFDTKEEEDLGYVVRAFPVSVLYQDKVMEPDERIKVLTIVASEDGEDASMGYFTFTREGPITDFNEAGWAPEVEASFVTGTYLGGDVIRNKQAPYTHVFTLPNPDTQLYVQTRWDNAIADSTGKWSNTQLANDITVDPSKYGVCKRRLRCRGWGMGLDLQFSVTPGTPCKIFGWAIEYEGNNAP